MAQEGKKMEKELKILQANLDKAKRKHIQGEVLYWEQAAITEILKNLQDFSMEKKNKSISNQQLMKKEVEESDTGYQQTLTDFNKFIEQYKDKLGQILDNFEKEEKERLHRFKDCGMKMLVLEASAVKFLEYDITAMANQL